MHLEIKKTNSLLCTLYEPKEVLPHFPNANILLGLKRAMLMAVTRKELFSVLREWYLSPGSLTLIPAFNTDKK